MKDYKTLSIRVYGIVQGVGFRPTVSRHADKNHIRGSVCNKGPYVEIWAQGSESELEGFLYDLEHNPPKRSSILKIDVHKEEESEKFQDFEIIESEHVQGEIFVSPDIAICPECKRELFDKNNRRYLHPFINCTCCGPRLTILDSMPYDRVRTSMGEFPMCPECEYEYTHAETRRYDAQPVCCNECGPEVYLIGRGERGRTAITYTRQVIHDGGIAAIKGIGGFHLCCDATNQEAVERLRKLKTRPAKPFAVMMRDMETVERECEVTKVQKEVLDGHQKPIILLKRKQSKMVCDAVTPDNPKIGVMLPYAPVQLLIFTYDDDIVMPDCLVMTSGNTSGAPICRDDNDAITELSKMCDVILSHNRMIRIRADDSVMDFFEEKPYMIRRSRGYAPLPFMVSNGFKGEVLAVGGELKNTFCIGKNDLFYQSPYVGDMEDLRTVKALKESITRLETLLETTPTIVACDMHPKYNTTCIAQEIGIPVFQVQHHYAHILSCMAENDYSDPVIGVSFDGTGYGTDATIWGGELLEVTYDGFERLGSIKPFIQIGGDMSAKEGWRIAVSMIYSIYKDKEKAAEVVRQLKLCDEKNCDVQFMMADNKINSITSTSAGRLFDAVSAILNIRKQSSFEGEASTTLEFAAEAYEEKHADHNSGSKITDEDSIELSNLVYENSNGQLIFATDVLVKKIIEETLTGKDAAMLAYFFHEKLSDMIAAGCIQASRNTGIKTIALSGGVYQNQLLLKMSLDRLRKLGFKVLIHSLLPPNDGGIALGQAVAAMEHINKLKKGEENNYVCRFTSKSCKG
ncbi:MULTISPECIES: carbamoyltransferase HypF [Clostridium]|uniref:Carbamoyltransferase n=1 Tax=Clostridium autoethanogenum DSM 10061 TaxID=1341692 RepID=A0ABM5NQQ9_9CLOT|nr:MULTISPECIES: carbamoyltransferase HypF [Clostridium]AGY74601.1 carbamoyltransferase HypF [Clostridium autoethanogenum DSM 10061]ALU34786.1 (NiFe) hydrogenase maturation protein HypF [Clostridium autoethanogenum DSM 10061]OVY51505.1 Carbamoyltransferase HypF [Clostridium autoethanogenum]QXE17628.1 carbamoyltransferase HypF [Clostridium sp. 001]